MATSQKSEVDGTEKQLLRKAVAQTIRKTILDTGDEELACYVISKGELFSERASTYNSIAKSVVERLVPKTDEAEFNDGVEDNDGDSKNDATLEENDGDSFAVLHQLGRGIEKTATLLQDEKSTATY